MPTLSKISEDYNTPILYLSFDGENNISNIDTKIEAFKDMIKAKKNLNWDFYFTKVNPSFSLSFNTSSLVSPKKLGL